MTKKDNLTELLTKQYGDALYMEQCGVYGTFRQRLSVSDMAEQLLDAGVEPVVYCKDCKYLGIKDFVYGYCEKNMCGMIGPRDYCSQGKIKKGKR